MKNKTLLLAFIFSVIALQGKAQITEDFEIISPPGWRFFETGGDDPGFIQTFSHPHGGSSSFYHNDDNISSTSTSWMVSPSHICGADDELRFWYYQNFTASYYNYSGVWISTNSVDPISNPSDFSEIQEFNASSPGGFSEDTWTEFVYGLGAYDGQTIYIAFKYTGDYEHELYIDDFSIASASPCIDPSALTTSAITAVTADLGWTENGTATQWDIELEATGFVPIGTPTANNVGTNPYTYTGLTPSTSYDFYVRADCGGGNTSAWIGPFNFTTPAAPCTDPSALSSSEITMSSSDLGWTENGFAFQWDVELGATGFIPTGTPTANNVNNNPYTYIGLIAGTSYDFYVRADCGGTTSNWVGPFNFTTDSPIPAGTDCANPFVIASLPFIQTGMTTDGFGNDYSSTDGCGSFTSTLNGIDFVIEYTPSVDECVKITLTNTKDGGYKGIGIHVHNGCPLNAASCMGNVTHDSIPYFPNIPFTAGVTYYFTISDNGSQAPTSHTPFDLRIESVPCVDESNDECVNAITLVQDSVCDPTLGSFWTATDDGDISSEGGCSYSNKDDVWYKFVARSIDPIIFVERYGTVSIYLYDNPAPCPSTVADLINCGQGVNQINTSGLTIGNTYYIKVASYASHFDYTFNICVYDFPPEPPCAANPTANDDCDWATMIDNLDGYCGNTSAAFTPGDIPASFCGTIENNSWLSFEATDTEASLLIFTCNCVVGEGIQMQIYETSDCANFTPVSNCWDPGVESNGAIIANNLTIGDTYYLMIDGFNGDNCDYTISGMTGVAVTLPVDLISCNCNKMNNQTIIYWETVSETNNNYFVIQRSEDSENFYDVGVVNGAGNSSQLLEYQWEDVYAANRQYYYRIKQFDYDGYYSYFDIITCRESNSNLDGLTYNYNPEDNSIEIFFAEENSTPYNLVIYDCVGRIVFNKRISGSSERCKVMMPEFSKGIYSMNIKGYDGNFSGKILKY